MYYVAGWNLPGYLPEMEPATFYSPENARDFLIDELRSTEDHWIDGKADVASVEQHYNELVEEVQHDTAPCSFHDTLSGLVFWIDLMPEEDTELGKKKQELADIENEISNYDFEPHKFEDHFDELMNETQDMIEIGNLKYEPALVLKRVDPIAYHEELMNYIDSLDDSEKATIDESYRELIEEKERLEDEIEELEND